MVSVGSLLKVQRNRPVKFVVGFVVSQIPASLREFQKIVNTDNQRKPVFIRHNQLLILLDVKNGPILETNLITFLLPSVETQTLVMIAGCYSDVDFSNFFLVVA